MYDDVGLEGSGEHTSESAEPAVVYEIDGGPSAESATGAPESPGAQAQPAPGPPPLADPRDTRIGELERQLAQVGAQLQPWLAMLQEQHRQRRDTPPFRIEDLDTDPNLKASDLGRYVEWKIQQEAERLRADSHGVARATLSEQQARGQFSREALGEGNDYDSLVSRYVAPLVQQNPAIEQLIHAVFPNDPATGRMWTAALISLVERSDGDIVKGLKAAFNGVGAYGQGAADVRQAITRSAAAAATRVLPTGPAAARATTEKLDSAEKVWQLSDAAFDREWERWGRATA